MSRFPEWPEELTPEQLDRLVDGEVDLDELRRVVEACENVPDGWRRCALAFLEAQALQQELSQFEDAFGDLANDLEDEAISGAVDTVPTSTNVGQQNGKPVSAMNGHHFPSDSESRPIEDQADPAQENVAASPKPTADKSASEADEKRLFSWVPKNLFGRSSGTSPVLARHSKERKRIVTRQRVASPVVIAATLIIAFVLGIAGRTYFDSPGSENRPSNLAELSGEHQTDGGTTLVNDPPNPAGRVSLGFLQDDSGEENADAPPLDVPLYDDQQLPAPEAIGLPVELQRELAANQVEVRSKRQLVELQTEDGQTVLMPLETLDFVPKSTRRYQ